MNVKQGHLDKIKQGGLRPAAKVPCGLQDQYEVKWDVWLCEDLTPIMSKNCGFDSLSSKNCGFDSSSSKNCGFDSSSSKN